MNQIQRGDTAKMGVLYERHKQDLFAYFYRLTCNRSKSEDLVQNTFMRMLTYCHRFRGDGQFKYWMFSIARNIWIDSYRKFNPLYKGRELTEVDRKYLVDQEDPQVTYERQERIDILQKALNGLSPEKREAIVLSRFHAMKYHEIALLANCTENTVKSRVRRGIEELKEIVGALK